MSRKSDHFRALYTDQSCASKHLQNYRTDKKDRTNITDIKKDKKADLRFNETRDRKIISVEKLPRHCTK